MTIDWAAIIAQVIAEITKCINNKRPQASIVASILDPEPSDDVISSRLVRKALGIGPLKWLGCHKEVMAAVHAQQSKLTEDDVNEWIELAQAV